MNITVTFSTAAVMLLAGLAPVMAQTYREVVNTGTYVSTGNCRVESETLLCDLFRKAGKEYLVVYDGDRRPYLVIRREDNIVTWKADMEA